MFQADSSSLRRLLDPSSSHLPRPFISPSHLKLVAFVFLLAAWSIGLPTDVLATADPAPASSTTSAEASLPGEEPRYPDLPNFHRVDDHLFRGGQPAPGGVARLKALGVRTIVNLRYEDSLVKAEEAEAREAGLQYFSVPMYGLLKPTAAQMASVLRIIDDPNNWPVFVHCKRGADRTGVIIACHRISRSNWTAERAIQEANDLGMGALEFAKRTYIKDFSAKLASGEVVVAASVPSVESPSSPSVPDAAPAQPISEQATGLGSEGATTR